MSRSRVLFLAMGIQFLLITLVVGFSWCVLVRLPVGGEQVDRWLQWSYEHRQAVWPGPVLLVIVIGAMVLIRELAWRQLKGAQASLYLRAVQLMANHRDLSGFERRRMKRLHKKK